ncbi:hypothetical protein QYE76_025582 [Lolium multiflorum]|uniref:Ribonuclease H1 N-terminal domain-containing protein n=1 Tax=Lolium multiflorum TaxID=4521 RepID=A0AAD8RFU7_LOLMU|nr:hypothetical protein QYE76_025582 [Lolium multiflorum]
MLPLQDSILVLESILLKDKYPNYPVFTVRVPRDVGFVTDAPGYILYSVRGHLQAIPLSRTITWSAYSRSICDEDQREYPDVAIRIPTTCVKASWPYRCGSGLRCTYRSASWTTRGRTTSSWLTFPKMPTYVVYKGRVPGVYEEWQDCLEQVHKFSGNSYKGYATREEAVAQWRAHVGKKKNRLKFLVPLLLTATAVVLYFTLV